MGFLSGITNAIRSIGRGVRKGVKTALPSILSVAKFVPGISPIANAASTILGGSSSSDQGGFSGAVQTAIREISGSGQTVAYGPNDPPRTTTVYGGNLVRREVVIYDRG